MGNEFQKFASQFEVGYEGNKTAKPITSCSLVLYISSEESKATGCFFSQFPCNRKNIHYTISNSGGQYSGVDES